MDLKYSFANVTRRLFCCASDRYLYQFVVFTLLTLLLKIVYIYASSVWKVDVFFYIEGARKIFDGAVLYKDYGEIKPPGVFFIYYLLLKSFGYHNMLLSVKFLNIITHVISALLISITGRSLFDKKTGFSLGLLMVVVLSIDRNFWPSNVMLFSMPFLILFIHMFTRKEISPGVVDYLLAGFFLGIGSVISTNLVVMALVVPVFALCKTKNIFSAMKHSLMSFLGFCVPYAFVIYYLASNHAIDDWLWWNFEWAAIYSGSKPVLTRIFHYIYGFFRTWELLPLYVAGFYSAYKILKSREYKADIKAMFIVTVFFSALLSRASFAKSEHRYYMYLIPAFLILAGYSRDKILPFIERRLVKRFLIFFVVLGLLVTNIYSAVKPYDSKLLKRKELHNWIISNSGGDDKIYVWEEGFEVYFMTKRKMATSFYSPDQHLTYTYAWKGNNYENIERPWTKFMDEITSEKPLLIVDLTKSFEFKMQKQADAPLVNRVENFKKYVFESYSKVKEFKEGDIWILKSDMTSVLK